MPSAFGSRAGGTDILVFITGTDISDEITTALFGNAVDLGARGG